MCVSEIEFTYVIKKKKKKLLSLKCTVNTGRRPISKKMKFCFSQNTFFLILTKE